MAELERSKKVLLSTNSVLSDEVRTLKAQKNVYDEDIANAKRALDGIQEQTSELNERQIALNAKNSGLGDSIESKKRQLEDLESQYIKTKEKENKTIAMLEIKKHELAQDIADSRASDTKTRQEIALWHRKLEERDKTLRIREARLSEQEGIIAKNEALLNL